MTWVSAISTSLCVMKIRFRPDLPAHWRLDRTSQFDLHQSQTRCGEVFADACMDVVWTDCKNMCATSSWLVLFCWLKRWRCIYSCCSWLPHWYRDPFHKRFMSRWSKFCQNMCHFYMKYDPITSQFCTCHRATLTCAKVWPDCMIRIKVRAKIIFTFELWAHKLCLKWVADILGPESI